MFAIPNLDFAQIARIASEIAVFLCLIGASKADLKTREIPNLCPILIVAIFAVQNLFLLFFVRKSFSTTDTLAQIVFALGILIVLLVVTVGFEKIQNKELFGGGDIKLVGATCLFLTFEAFSTSLLIACCLEVLVSVFKKLRGQNFCDITLPFAPFWTIGILGSFTIQLLI